ncbi:hypothetical protein HK098_003251 [Nowakowskiella sp. JEL0407]|nr:hypothetical protein HK098_003251 [Nowakowskiella sp. JEL0407]
MDVMRCVQIKEKLSSDGNQFGMLTSLTPEILHHIISFLHIIETIPLYQSCGIVRRSFKISPSQLCFTPDEFSYFEPVSSNDNATLLLHNLETLQPAIHPTDFTLIFKEFKTKLLFELHVSFTHLNPYNTKTIMRYSNLKIYDFPPTLIRTAYFGNNIELILDLHQISRDRGEDIQPSFLLTLSHASFFGRIGLIEGLFSKVKEFEIDPELVLNLVLKRAASTRNGLLLDVVMKWETEFGVFVELESAM